MDDVRFSVLGPLEVVVGDQRVTLGSPKQRALLTTLLLDPQRVVSTDRLTETIWGDDPPVSARNAVQTYVARLRSALEPADGLVATRPPGYALEVPASAIDATRFESLVGEARQLVESDPAAASDRLDAALALWRGAAYAEFAEGFARPAAVRLEELRLAAREDRAELALRLGAWHEAVGRAEALATDHPFRERPIALVVRALHAAGRTAEALAALRAYRERVADELGLDLSPPLQQLEQRLLRQEPFDQPRHPQAAGSRVDADESPRPPPASARPRGIGAPPDPAATRAATTRSELPEATSSFVGREADCVELDALVAPGRVVTLVGPGGVGKTRLALEHARRRRAEGQPVWWVDLASLQDRDDLIRLVADAAGVDLEPGEDRALALRAALRSRSGLLVFDNCEHVVDEVAALVEPLAHLHAGADDARSGLALLATSRERFGTDREVARQVEPLPADGADPDSPAIRLFLDRYGPPASSDVGEHDRALIAAICRQLDGLPLAIELAAARAVSLGLTDVADRLGQRFDLLARGRPTSTPRHQTLRAVVDWSYELLRPAERLLFERLSVFPGSFDLANAEVVCADEQLPARRIAGVMASLIERCMVQTTQARTGRRRYWLLETLRRYAADRLEERGELTAVGRRHTEVTLRQVEERRGQLWTAEEPDAVAHIAGLLDDLRAAWAWAVHNDDADLMVRLPAALFDFAYYRQRDDLLGWGLTAADAVAEHPRLPLALAAAAGAAWGRNDLRRARELAVRGVAAAGGPHAPEAAAPLEVLGDTLMLGGDPLAAETRWMRTFAHHESHHDQARAAVQLTNQSLACAFSGRAAEAVDRAEEAVALATASACPTSLAMALYARGEALADDDPDTAVEALVEAEGIAASVDNRLVIGVARTAAVSIRSRHGDPFEAAQVFRGVIDTLEATGNRTIQWTVLRNLVVLLQRLGAHAATVELAAACMSAANDKPAWGQEGERLETALGAATRALGDAAAEPERRGRMLDLEGAVDAARRAIDLVLEGPRVYAHEDQSPEQPGRAARSTR